MSIDIETLRRTAKLGLEAHQRIVDAYIAVGMSIDKIAEAKGFYQPDSADVLHGYGFKLGSEWGDRTDDRYRYRNIPQELVNEYVEHFFPGIDEAVEMNRDITMDKYMDIYHPGWRNMTDPGYTGILSRKLTDEEKEILEYGSPQEKKLKVKGRKKENRWTKLY